MRERPQDEDGNDLPFTDFADYRKLEWLLPGADCNTRAGKITEWRDARPQPTYDEIEAVTDLDVQAAEIEKEENGFRFPDALKALATAVWKQENRLRDLDGHPRVTFRQFAGALRRSL